MLNAVRDSVESQPSACELLARHPASPKSSARSGVRRMTRELAAKLPAPMPRDDFLELLADRPRAETVSSQGVVHWQTSSGVVSNLLTALEVPNGRTLRPARRIGGFRGASSRGGMFATEREGMSILLQFESRLEYLWLVELARNPLVSWVQTQPFAISWRTGNQGLYKVPDLLLRTIHGELVVGDVKPSEALVRSDYVRSAFEFIGMSLARANVRYVHLGDMTPQRRANLQAIAAHRVANTEVMELARRVRELGPRTLGAIVDSGGSGAKGRATALHLLATGLHADLARSISMSTQVDWRHSAWSL